MSAYSSICVSLSGRATPRSRDPDPRSVALRRLLDLHVLGGELELLASAFERCIQDARREAVGVLQLLRARRRLIAIVDHHQRELTARGRHRAGTDAADRRALALPGETAADRRDRAGDRLRRPALPREQR